MTDASTRRPTASTPVARGARVRCASSTGPGPVDRRRARRAAARPAGRERRTRRCCWVPHSPPARAAPGARLRRPGHDRDHGQHATRTTPSTWRAALARPRRLDRPARRQPPGRGRPPAPPAGTTLYLDRFWTDERRVARRSSRPSAAAPPTGSTMPSRPGLAACSGDGDSPTCSAWPRPPPCCAGSRSSPAGPARARRRTVARVLALLDEQAAAAGRRRRWLHWPRRPGRQRPASRRPCTRRRHDLRRRCRGARRACWRCEGSTLHRLLGFNPGTAAVSGMIALNRLPHDVVVVDETLDGLAVDDGPPGRGRPYGRPADPRRRPGAACVGRGRSGPRRHRRPGRRALHARRRDGALCPRSPAACPTATGVARRSATGSSC